MAGANKQCKIIVYEFEEINRSIGVNYGVKDIRIKK
jgi:hypothetical protein